MVALALFVSSIAVRLVNSDSIVSSLISTNRLTFYYWDQDRLASVVPLIAWPFQSVRANLFTQLLVNALAFVGLLLVFVRHHLANRVGVERPSALVTVLALLGTGVATTWILTDQALTVFVVEQQYALSLLLFLGGLRVLVGAPGPVRFAGFAPLLVGLLLIPSTVLYVPVVWLLRAPDRPVARRMTAVAGAAAAFGLASLASTRFGVDSGTSDLYADFSLARLVDGALPARDSVLSAFETLPTVAAVAVVLVAVIIDRERLPRTSALTAIAGLAFAAGWFLLFTANAWVEQNLFYYRYYFPVLVAFLYSLAGAMSVLSVRAVDLARGRPVGPDARRLVLAAASAAILVVGVVGAGRFATGSRPAVLRDAAPVAEAAAREDVTLVVGSYWTAWPVVFESQARGHELYAISGRSAAIVGLIGSLIDRRNDDGRIRIMCLDVETATCVAEVSDLTGTPWTLVGQQPSSTPVLVIER